MSLVLTDIQEVTLSVAPVSAAGNPAPVEGPPVWSVSDPTVGAVTVAADGLSAKFVTTGKLGLCQVNVSADADLGPGVKTITGVLEVEVVASEAANLGVTAGTPADKA
jgi:hypothetical protein